MQALRGDIRLQLGEIAELRTPYASSPAPPAALHSCVQMSEPHQLVEQVVSRSERCSARLDDKATTGPGVRAEPETRTAHEGREMGRKVEVGMLPKPVVLGNPRPKAR